MTRWPVFSGTHLQGRPILAVRELGKGKVLACGTADLLTNRAISEKLHEPLNWGEPKLPKPSRNIEVRQGLGICLFKRIPVAAGVPLVRKIELPPI